ncbi:MAG: hypothetical protein KatS3mg020_0029 [Fimbriimonadales bacterium]|nr:MAG: hypothetical protein KatS3mg020_0029 [Fimbriimonadales bacterium]
MVRNAVRFVGLFSSLLLAICAVLGITLYWIRSNYGSHPWDIWRIDTETHARLKELLAIDRANQLSAPMKPFRVVAYQRLSVGKSATYARLFLHKENNLIFVSTVGESEGTPIVELIVASADGSHNSQSIIPAKVSVRELWDHPELKFLTQGRLYCGDTLLHKGRWRVGGAFGLAPSRIYYSDRGLGKQPVELLLGVQISGKVSSRLIIMRD